MVGKEETHGTVSGFEVFGLAEDSAADGEGGDHEAVPTGDDLVIKAGRDARGAGGTELREQAVDAFLEYVGMGVSVVGELFDGFGDGEDGAAFDR